METRNLAATIQKFKQMRALKGIPGRLVYVRASVDRSRLSELERGYALPSEKEMSAEPPAFKGPEVAEGTAPMTPQALTGLLAERVMGWTAAPNRFMQGRRRWIPSWRFQPCESLADAFQLLDTAKACRANL